MNNVKYMLAKKKFSALVETIVKDHCTPSQYEMFLLEGNDMIDKLFTAGEISNLRNEKIDSSKSFAFSPGESVDLIKAGVDFIGVIVTSFSIYLEYMKVRETKKNVSAETTVANQHKITNVDTAGRLEELNAIKSWLASENIPEDMRKIFTEKYTQKMLEIIDEI